MEPLKQFICQELLSDSHPDLAEDQNLLTTGLVDSIGVTRLIAFLEETYDLKIPPEDVTLENFSTLRQIRRYVERQHPEG